MDSHGETLLSLNQLRNLEVLAVASMRQTDEHLCSYVLNTNQSDIS